MADSSSAAFEQVPRTQQGHFRLNFYAAVYRLIYHCARLGQIGGTDLQALFAAYPFMERYLTEIARYLPEGIAWDEALAWWEEEITAWEATIDAHLPLVALSQGSVGFAGRLAFLLGGLVEEDFRFGVVFAKLQEPLAYRRPCLTLIGQILVTPAMVGEIDVWRIYQPLFQGGYVEVMNPDVPRSEWLLRVPSLLWDALRGEVAPQPAPGCRYYPPTAVAPLAELIFPPAFLDRLEQVPALIEDGRAQAIVLRGMEGSERLEVAGSIARRLGWGIIELCTPAHSVGQGEDTGARYQSLVGPLCTLAHAMPVVTYDLGPGETAELPALPGYAGPLGVLIGLEGGLKGPFAERAIALTLPMPGIAERQQHWRRALEGQAVEDWSVLCERFQLPGGHIRRVGTLASAYAALEGRQSIDTVDIRQACRTLNRQMLDALAVYLEADGSWGQLVVSPETGVKLRELEQRCRHRERLLAHLGPGFGKGCNRGVRALFTGASGTGKTLAARILAAELDMDLYRVDLGAVVNKYIGETEKNLHRVLSRAEELDVILLLDEGDALLGNRTEVKSANDRYANLETNYLLQRLENYQGIVIVTTNAGQYIDNAFQRRMDVVVHFVPPQGLERWHIWQLHLPTGHAVDSAYLEAVATRCALTGGQIRNAALHATLLTVDEGNAVMGRRHLEQAVLSEYRKAGATCPLDSQNLPNPTHGGMEAFLGALLN